MKTSFPHSVCVSSPVRRSGTTLVQRLLCSSSNALIYGENCANDLQILLSLWSNKQMLLAQGKNWRNRQMESVLAGKVNNWIPDLMPDIDGYITAYKKAVDSILGHYFSFAQNNGRNIWGMKMPEWNPANLQYIQRIYPETKIIYIHRELGACVRSAKKMEMVGHANDIHQFCQTYQQYTTYADRHLKNENVLHIQYEELVENPEIYISKIEKFTGAKNIDHEVMTHKVNTYENDHKLEVGDGKYLKPAELTEEEIKIISAFSEANVFG